MNNADNISLLSTMIEFLDNDFFKTEELKNKKFKIADFELTIQELKTLLETKKNICKSVEHEFSQTGYTPDEFSMRITELANLCGGNVKGFVLLTEMIRTYQKVHNLATQAVVEKRS